MSFEYTITIIYFTQLIDFKNKNWFNDWESNKVF